MTPRARLALAIIVLLAVVVFAYRPALDGAFVWDDHALVETNPLVEHGTLREIFRQPYWTATPWSDVRPVYYRPLTMLSLRADFEMAGDEAAQFHFTNLLLHLLATVALVLAARRLGAGARASVLAGAVWAVHPRTTECVAWISGRTDVLVAVFGFAAIAVWPWLRGSGSGSGSASASASGSGSGSRREKARAAMAGGLVLAALLAKEVAFAVVLAMVVGTIASREKVARRLAWIAAPVAVYFTLRFNATHHDTARLVTLGARARGGIFLEALGRYAFMILDPWQPASSIGLVGELDGRFAALGGVVLLAGAALFVRFVRRGSRRRSGTQLLVPIALGAGALGLVVHLVPIVLATSVVADRLLYLPLAALVTGLAVASARLSPARRRMAAAAAIALVVSFVPVTRARAGDYTDELRFRVVAAEHAHPHSTAAKSGLANALRAAAEVPLACTLHASIRAALERDGRAGTPRHVVAVENLGSCYAVLGDYEKANAAFDDVLAFRSASGRVHLESGLVALHLRAFDKAEASLATALKLEPGLTLARETLEDLPALRAATDRFATKEARDADRPGWAQLLTSLGRVPDANEAWLDVVLDPSSEDWPTKTGFEFLLANADTATVLRASEVLFARTDFYFAKLAKWKLRRRLATASRIEALRPRIEALAAPTPPLDPAR